MGLSQKSIRSVLAVFSVSFAFLVPLKTSVSATRDGAGVLQSPSSRLRFTASGNSTVLKPESLLRLEQLIARLKLRSLSRSPFLQAFTTDSFDRTLFVSVRTLSSENSNRFFRHPDGVFTQTEIADQTVGLFFSGFEADDVVALVRDFRAQYSASVPSPSSQAATREPASEAVGSWAGAKAKDFAKSVSEIDWIEQTLESYVGCGLGPARAFNAVTVDPLYSAYKNAAAWKEMSFEKHWSLIKRDYDRFVEGLKFHTDMIVRGYDKFLELPTKEKSAFVCSVVLGGGAGSVAAKAVSKSAQAEKAVLEAQRRASQRAARPRSIVEREATEKPPMNFELSKNPLNPEGVDRGVTVEMIEMPDSVFAKFYDPPDLSKVRKAPEPPPKPVAPVVSGTDAWFTSVVKLADGFTETIIYKVLELNRSTGKILIEFMNPLDRGVWQKKEFSAAELRTGFKALDKPPVGLEAAPAL